MIGRLFLCIFVIWFLQLNVEVNAKEIVIDRAKMTITFSDKYPLATVLYKKAGQPYVQFQIGLQEMGEVVEPLFEDLPPNPLSLPRPWGAFQPRRNVQVLMDMPWEIEKKITVSPNNSEITNVIYKTYLRDGTIEVPFTFLPNAEDIDLFGYKFTFEKESLKWGINLRNYVRNTTDEQLNQAFYTEYGWSPLESYKLSFRVFINCTTRWISTALPGPYFDDHLYILRLEFPDLPNAGNLTIRFPPISNMDGTISTNAFMWFANQTDEVSSALDGLYTTWFDAFFHVFTNLTYDPDLRFLFEGAGFDDVEEPPPPSNSTIPPPSALLSDINSSTTAIGVSIAVAIVFVIGIAFSLWYIRNKKVQESRQKAQQAIAGANIAMAAASGGKVVGSAVGTAQEKVEKEGADVTGGDEKDTGDKEKWNKSKKPAKFTNRYTIEVK